jgi:hypothetical protein
VVLVSYLLANQDDTQYTSRQVIPLDLLVFWNVIPSGESPIILRTFKMLCKRSLSIPWNVETCASSAYWGINMLAIQYGLDGPGIESQYRRDFLHPSGPALWPSVLLHNAYRVLCPPVVKRPGFGVNHPPPSSAEVKERVEMYIHSPSVPSRSVLERNLPFWFSR